MLEGIPLGVADLSGWGLCVVLVTLNVVGLFRGWVVPKPFFDLTNTKVEHLRTQVDEQREIIATQARTIEKQTAVGDTVVKVVSSMQDARVLNRDGTS